MHVFFPEGTAYSAARYKHSSLSCIPLPKGYSTRGALKSVCYEAVHPPVPLSAEVIFYVHPHMHRSYQDTRHTHKDNFLNPNCHCHTHKMPGVALPCGHNTDTVPGYFPVLSFLFISTASCQMFLLVCRYCKQSVFCESTVSLHFFLMHHV